MFRNLMKKLETQKAPYLINNNKAQGFTII